jgi:amidohydrolase
MAKTGLVVDIYGTGSESEEGDIKSCAFRSDIDALKMPENSNLPFKTTTDHAHMCGHDGHMATLMTFTSLIQNNLDKIPSNKLIRLIWQPAEEGPGGAKPMIEEGCLEGIDEIYGIHNFPLLKECAVSVMPGPMMAGCTVVKITVKGRGGHGSEPCNSIDPLTATCHIHTALNAIKSHRIPNAEVMAFTICQIDGGSTFNVIPEKAFMQGTIRYFDKRVLDITKAEITRIATNTAEAHGCTVEIELIDYYPSTTNHETQA